MTTKQSAPVAVYKKGNRVFLRLPHAKNDIVIDKEEIPNPFITILEEYGNAIIRQFFIRPRDYSAFLPSESEMERRKKQIEEEKKKEKEELEAKKKAFAEKYGKNKRPTLQVLSYELANNLIRPYHYEIKYNDDVLEDIKKAYARGDYTRFDLPFGFYVDYKGEVQHLPMTPTIRALASIDQTMDCKKYIKRIFTSHLRFIRQDVDGAMYGEQNPDLTTDPENDGSPDNSRL